MPPRKSTSAESDETPQTQIQTATEQQLKARAEGGVSIEDYLLPRSLTLRLAKSVLPPNTSIQKDAVLAIQKAATVFVSYLSSHANEATLKRIVAPSDVLTALSEIEFDSFRPRLEKELQAHTDLKVGKRKGKKGAADAAANGTGTTSTMTNAQEAEVEEEEETVHDVKRVKRAKDVEDTEVGGDADDDDETQEAQEDDVDEDEEEEEDDDDEEGDEEEEEEGDGHNIDMDADIDRVEDLDADSRSRKSTKSVMDPDGADDSSDDGSDDDRGPGS